MKLRHLMLASSSRNSDQPLVGLVEKPYFYFGSRSGMVIIPIIGVPVPKKIFKIVSGSPGKKPQVIYEGADARAAADAYARLSAEEVFRQLTEEPKAPESLHDLLSGFAGGVIGYSIGSYTDPLPDGSFKFEEGKIVAGADDSETGLVVFQLSNQQGLALLGDDDKRPVPIAREADIETGGRYPGHVLIFAFNKGDSVYLADPDQKLVFHCVWNGDQIEVTTYTEKEFLIFANIIAPKDTVPALTAGADTES